MVPGTRTKKLKILQNRCRTGNQEPNQEVQALTSWVDQEVIGLTRMLLAFYKKLLFFYQENRLDFDVLNVFLDVHLYLRLKNHIDVFLDVFNIVLDVVLGIDIEVTFKVCYNIFSKNHFYIKLLSIIWR